MKKYSRLDLLSNALVDNAGGLVYRLFDRRHARLDIRVSTYDFKRAQVFVGTVNEIIEEETDIVYTLEKLVETFYLDFLRSIDRGLTIDELAKWIRSVQNQFDSDHDISITHYSREIRELNIQEIKQEFKKRHSKKEEFTYISVKIDKQHILKGEVLLHDLYELHKDLDLDVEEFLSLRFKDIIMQIKSGNYEILKNIVDLVLH